jgi:hypothetical protein
MMRVEEARRRRWGRDCMTESSAVWACRGEPAGQSLKGRACQAGQGGRQRGEAEGGTSVAAAAAARAGGIGGASHVCVLAGC